MTDFLITEMTFYPWFTWLIVFLALAGVAYVAVWVHALAGLVSDWVARKRASLEHERATLEYEASVKRRLAAAPCEVCELAEEEIRSLGLDDPPESQHPDGDDDLLPEPSEDKVLAFLATVKAMGLLDEDDDRPAGWLGNRCTNRDCYRYGEDHAGACDVAPTMPAACYLEGPAMPPQPVREFLHPAIMDTLADRGFSEHETNDGAVDSMYTRAMAREVEAMVTDGIIPTGEAGKE